jgi:hypothetical protein
LDAEELQEALQGMEADDVWGVYIRDRQELWRALSKIHAVVNWHPADLERLDRAIIRYRLALGTFEFEGAPKPCLMKRRLY